MRKGTAGYFIDFVLGLHGLQIPASNLVPWNQQPGLTHEGLSKVKQASDRTCPMLPSGRFSRGPAYFFLSSCPQNWPLPRSVDNRNIQHIQRNPCYLPASFWPCFLTPCHLLLLTHSSSQSKTQPHRHGSSGPCRFQNRELLSCGDGSIGRVLASPRGHLSWTPFKKNK